MGKVKEKIAYLKGLIEGSDFVGKDEHARQVWEKMLEIFDEVAESVDDLEAGHEEVEEYLEAIDSDLCELEEEVYGDYDEDDDEDEDEDVDFVEMECPNCRETVYFEEDFLYDDDVEVSCPECGQVIYNSEGATENGSADREVADDEES